MPIPTLQDYGATVWNTTATPKASKALTWQAGDVFLIGGIGENNSLTFTTPTLTGVTFASLQVISSASYCETQAWGATAAGTGSALTASVGNSGSSFVWGHHVYQFRGSDGIGASNKANLATGDPSVTLSTTQANSSIVCFGGDWNAGATTGKAWLPLAGATTPTAGNGFEKVGAQQGGSYTVYSALYDDAGAIGSKTVGMTDPNGMQWAFIAVEIKGSAGVPPTLVGSYFMPFFQ